VNALEQLLPLLNRARQEFMDFFYAVDGAVLELDEDGLVFAGDE